MSRGTIDFYFDIISPYSYVAFEALLQHEIPLKINFKPVSIGHVFKASENRPPALCPPKGVYGHSDMLLIADYWNVPFRHVSDFAGRVLGGNTSKTQLFLTAVRLHQPNDMKKLMRAFWIHLYYEDNDIFSEDDIRKVCNKVGVRNVEKLLELSKSDSVKQSYRTATNEAIESGAFGVPWMVITENGKKSFNLFGTDRLHILFHKFDVPFQRPKQCAKL